MSRIIERVIGGLLSAVAFFDNIRARRNDDEVTTEYRARQRACVWGSALTLLGIAGVFLVTGLFEALSSAFQNSAPLEGIRGTVAIGLLAAVGGALIYTTYAYWALWRFINVHGDR